MVVNDALCKGCQAWRPAPAARRINGTSATSVFAEIEGLFLVSGKESRP
jgi:hypothetical protein